MTEQAGARGMGDGAAGVVAGQGALREPYFIGLNRRAMVSLGPLRPKTYCTYKCAFCYVQGPFPRYATRTAKEIVDWLDSRASTSMGKSPYDIVYVSGDTDSFAKPRTAQGIELLDMLLSLKEPVDVLYTTRYVFSAAERSQIEVLTRRYAEAGLLLIPCISVSQLNYPNLEPHPVPPPAERLAQVRWLHGIGAPVILTVRPFLPYIPADEYVEIVRQGSDCRAVVLGGDWYADETGVVDGLTRVALEPQLGRISPAPVFEPPGPLDFSVDDTKWTTYRHPVAEAAVAEACAKLDVPYFMRSEQAVDFLRNRVDR
ncbi:hypothetical protein SAMN05421812_11627 [Asanoa hainanensis]|uniref:DNA repair photolyase n=1 Tax=Asanoa hainanensis TaxID=560556 RepID=A0A239PB76_9ACTN|nr:radical SAM protein [Asanoa hainanensis]SNT63914.1 hypothetical protein SAMN05421812_11627 [Asanoa hainanensis]